MDFIFIILAFQSILHSLFPPDFQTPHFLDSLPVLLISSLCRYCFIVTLGYLILCQITRVYVFDYGMYSADFTG